jgi:iron(III) transport system ATP-binding protein
MIDAVPAVKEKLSKDMHNYIRLERIYVNANHSADDIVLEGTVESSEYYGLYIKYVVDAGCQKFKVIEKNDGINLYEKGQKVKISFNPRDIMSYPA